VEFLTDEQAAGIASLGSVLRQLRVPLVFATLVAAASAAYVGHASGVVQRQLDAEGVPACLDPNVCYPHGAAMDAVFGLELNAAITPALIGLVLGAALAVEGRQGRRASSLGATLIAGVVLTGLVATTHRLVGARYTVLANDTYEGLQLLHLNHPGFMIMLTLVTTALGAVIGLRAGRAPRTGTVTPARWPAALVVTYAVFALAGVVAWPAAAVFGADGGRPAGPYAADIGFADGLGYVASVLLAVCLVALISAARRGGTAASPGATPTGAPTV
jgi:hypothetical protein